MASQTNRAIDRHDSERRDHWSDSVTERLKELLRDQEGADLTLKIGNEEHRFHKIILRSQSKFVDKACRNFKEAQADVIELNHGESEMLRRVVAWLNGDPYCDGTCKPLPKDDDEDEQEADEGHEVAAGANIANGAGMPQAANNGGDVADDQESSVTSENSLGDLCQHPLTFDIAIFALADFYDIPALREAIASSQFTVRVNGLLPSTAWDNDAPSRPSEDPNLGEEALKSIKEVKEDDKKRLVEFCKLVRQIYTTTPSGVRELREVIVQDSVERQDKLCSHKEFLDLVLEVPEYAQDLLVASAKALCQDRSILCNRCDQTWVRKERCRCQPPSNNPSWGTGQWEWFRRDF